MEEKRLCAYCGAPVSGKHKSGPFAFCSVICERGFKENMRKLKGDEHEREKSV